MAYISRGKIKFKRVVQDIIPPYSSLTGDFLEYIPLPTPQGSFIVVIRKASASIMVLLLILTPIHRLFASEGEDPISEPIVTIQNISEIEPAMSAEPEVTPEVTVEPETQQQENESSPGDTPEPSIEVTPESQPETDLPVTETPTPEPTPEVTPEVIPEIQSSGGGVLEENVQEEEIVEEVDSQEPLTEENTDTVKMRQEILEEIFRELSVSSLQELKNKIELADKNIKAESVYAEKTGVSSASSEFFSAKDDEGDSEIYSNLGGKEIQITDNSREDDSVSWDLSKKFLTWQSLVDGRWQIVFYDVDKKTEQQVTDTDFNNTNPSIQAGSVVWQGWVKDNWEIFVGQRDSGESAEQPWKIRQLTDNYYHDMFPKIAGNMIVWQAFYNGNWHVFIHDLLTGETKQVSDGDSSNENPRFTVVWDNKGSEGVRTIAYDVVMGQTVSLNSAGDTKEESSGKEPVPFPNSNEMPVVNIQTGTSTASKSGSGDGNGDGDI